MQAFFHGGDCAMSLHRRLFLAAGATVAAPTLWAQAGHAHHHPASHGAGHPPLPVAPPSAEPYARLRDGQPHHLTPDQTAQRSFQSPAPAGLPGRWITRAALPIPRSEMAWATEWAGRMHVIGG